MCRLYGQLSPALQSARDFLVDGERSLLRQSNCTPGRFQKDGWGVGYFDGKTAKTVRSAKAAFEEPGRMRSLAARVRSRVVIGHLRAASNPLGIPLRRLINIESTQPFTDGEFLFAHNGTVEIPAEVARFLGPYRSRVRGQNDSEVYFWQFRKFFDLYRDVPAALAACADELWSLWELCRRRHPSKKKPHHGLNTLISDGKSLHALCLYKTPTPSFFNPRQKWGTLSFGKRDGRAVFASEDVDAGSWGHFQLPEIISAKVSGAGLTFRRRRLSPKLL